MARAWSSVTSVYFAFVFASDIRMTEKVYTIHPPHPEASWNFPPVCPHSPLTSSCEHSSDLCENPSLLPKNYGFSSIFSICFTLLNYQGIVTNKIKLYGRALKPSVGHSQWALALWCHCSSHCFVKKAIVFVREISGTIIDDMKQALHRHSLLA